jgi:ribokinase
MPKVIVAGSINMDVVATVERHPRVGETVLGRELLFTPGGKGANQAVAAARQGAHTVLVGKLGVDGFADSLRGFLRSQGVNLEQVLQEERAATGTALIVVGAGGQNTIVVVSGANSTLSPADTASVQIDAGDVLVSQFEIPMDTIRAFFSRGRDRGATTLLNLAPALPCDDDLLALADIVVANETELGFFVGETIEEDASDELLVKRCARLRRHPQQRVVLTLGARGAIAVAGTRTLKLEGRRVDAIDTTGAGDCFVGSLAAALSQGGTLEDALEAANIAASICVTRRGAGASMPTRDEVLAELKNR